MAAPERLFRCMHEALLFYSHLLKNKTKNGSFRCEDIMLLSLPFGGLIGGRDCQGLEAETRQEGLSSGLHNPQTPGGQ